MFDPISIIFSVVSMASTMVQQRQQMKQQQKAAQQKLNVLAKEQWDAYEKEEKKRRDLLKRNLAKKRARMGGAGFSAADGSAGAIIQGLRNDTAEASHDDYSGRAETIEDKNQSLTAGLLEQSKKDKRAIYKQAAGVAGNAFGVQGLDTLTGFALSDEKDPAELLQGATDFGSSLMAKS